MGIKSSMGASSVNAPSGKGSIKIVSGKAIVNKAINRHHANPGFKKGK